MRGAVLRSLQLQRFAFSVPGRLFLSQLIRILRFAPSVRAQYTSSAPLHNEFPQGVRGLGETKRFDPFDRWGHVQLVRGIETSRSPLRSGQPVRRQRRERHRAAHGGKGSTALELNRPAGSGFGPACRWTALQRCYDLNIRGTKQISQVRLHFFTSKATCAFSVEHVRRRNGQRSSKGSHRLS